MSRVRIRQEGDRTVLLLRARPAGTVALVSSLLLLLLEGGWWVLLGWLADDLQRSSPGSAARVDALAGNAVPGLILMVSTFLAARTAWRALLHHEIATLDSGTLILQRRALFPSFPRRFSCEWMRHLRVAAEAGVVNEEGVADPWESDSGRNVAFDYGPRTVRFGLRLEEADAQEVVAAIGQRETISDTPFSYGASSHETSRDPLTPPAPRARVHRDGQTLRVTVPALKSWLLGVLCFLALAFLIWPVAAMWFLPGAGFALLRHGWLLCVLLVVTVRRLFWNAFGKEELLLTEDGALTLAHHYGLFRRRWQWRAEHVGQVAVALQRASALGGDALPERGSITIAVLEGSQYVPHRFGVGLEEAEAQALVALLWDRLDALRSSAFEGKAV